MTSSPTLTIRPAREPEIRRLAALDSQRPLRGDALLAELDGRPVAAVAIADGRVVADPFQRTAAVAAVLSARAAQVRDAGAGASRLRAPRSSLLRTS